jgi:hypothetical protein
MYFHIFELTNNKYFIIYNNYEIYNIDTANMEYNSYPWIKLYSFNKYIETVYTINISNISKYLIKYGITNSRSNVEPFNTVVLNYKNIIDLCSYSNESDKWTYYGLNYIERIKNRNLIAKQL